MRHPLLLRQRAARWTGTSPRGPVLVELARRRSCAGVGGAGSTSRSISRRRRGNPFGRHGDETGQSLVEFALVIPLFLVLVIGVIEFAFLLSANLSVSYATRDAALVAAEAGDTSGADCLILQKIENDVTAPSSDAAIQGVQIYWSDQNGNVKSGAINAYARTGNTTCSINGTNLTVPYSKVGALLYPDTDRCNVILGTGCANGHTGLDTIGVKLTYQYSWHTPLRCLVGLVGSGNGGCWSNTAGWTLVSSNAMRMEPVL